MSARLIQDDVREPVKELYRDLCHLFPELTHFYGYASVPDHNSRRCLDAMVYDSSGKELARLGRTNLPYSERIALGDRVLAFLRKNAEHYHLNGVIWNHHVYGFPTTQATAAATTRGPYGEARPYTLKAHDDHLHIELDGRPFRPLREWDGHSFPGAWAFAVGQSHPAVTLLDERLIAHHFDRHHDGDGYQAGPVFTEHTRQNVQDAQEAQGFTGPDADGIPGATTWAYLMAEPKAGTPKPPKTPEVVPVPDPVREEPEMSATIVFGNPLWNNDRRRKPWPQRKADVVRHLTSTGATVIMVCEIDGAQAADIHDLLTGAWGYWRVNGGNRYGPLAIYWRQDTWERAGDAFEREFSDNESRYLLRLPLRHKASGRVVPVYCTHLENEGDPRTDGHAARRAESRDIVKWTLDGPGVLGLDGNSTTRSTSNATQRQREKPRPILRAGGWQTFLSEVGVKNGRLASHHGAKAGPPPEGAWIDDLVVKDLQIVKDRSALIRTDGDDCSDHHFLSVTIKL